jgi:Tfp pilus assembly protein PilF
MKKEIAAFALSLVTISSLYAADVPSTAPANVSASTRIAAARKAIDGKDWALAIRELDAAAKDDPRNADVQNLLGYSWRKRSVPDLNKAFEHYKQALQLDPRHKGAHEYIGEAYLSSKKPAEAEAHLAHLEAICGNKTCPEYVALSASIAAYKRGQ